MAIGYADGIGDCWQAAMDVLSRRRIVMDAGTGMSSGSTGATPGFVTPETKNDYDASPKTKFAPTKSDETVLSETEAVEGLLCL